jgi:lipopolysaccharide export system permease protein
LILKSKNDHTFKKYKIKIYFLGFLFIIFLESSSKFISTNILQTMFISVLPLFLIFAIYFYFLTILKVKNI